VKWLFAFLALARLTSSAVQTITIPCFLDSEAPSDIQVQWQAKPRGIMVSWQINTDQASGYRIYRMTVLDQGFGIEQVAGEVGPGENSYLDRHAHAKLAYVYLVVAVNACGESAFYDGVVCLPSLGH
jgi:hypothetical protein